MKKQIETTLFIIILLINATFISKAQEYQELKLYSIIDNKMLIKGSKFNFKIVFNRKISDKIEVKFNNDLEHTKYILDNEEIRISSVATNVGVFNISGNILIKRDNKIIKKLPFKQTFYVNNPNVTVINKRGNKILMNNVEQEISVSIEGVLPFNIKLKTDNGEIKKKGILYYIKPEKIGNCNLFIEAELTAENILKKNIEFIVQ